MRRTFRWLTPPISLWLAGLALVADINTPHVLGQQSTDPAFVALVQEGEAIFSRDCLTCHAADGGEDMGPALSRSPVVGLKDEVIRRVLAGKKDMPGFEKTLTDREVAAVATYVRNSWENALGVVLETDVTRLRKGLTEKP